MVKYLVKIMTYLVGSRVIAECDTQEEAEKVLSEYNFKRSPIVRENEVEGWIEEVNK